MRYIYHYVDNAADQYETIRRIRHDIKNQMSALEYMIENGFRGNAKLPNPFHAGQVYDNSQANVTVPDAVETLKRLGY